METWRTDIKDSETFAAIYSNFFELYNNGEQPEIISKKILNYKWKNLEKEEDMNSLWFALALAQWETKSLEPKVLSKIEDIITSRTDLKIWFDLGASGQDIKKRKIALDEFLEKIKSDRPKAKPRKREKLKKPIFATGDCLVFKLMNGNYGGAVVLAADINPRTAFNMVATTRLNQSNKPTLKDFESAEVLIWNFEQWQDKVDINLYMPDLFYKDYADIYENIGKIQVNLDYERNDDDDKDYLYNLSLSSVWSMNIVAQIQFLSELTKPKPTKTITIKQLNRKNNWRELY
ncbi:MAG: hypothetical protein WCQ95_06455 [Bacteroidota bacterium]